MLIIVQERQDTTKVLFLKQQRIKLLHFVIRIYRVTTRQRFLETDTSLR